MPDIIPYHTLHEANKTPECDRIVLHDRIDRRKEITHPLDIAQVAVIFVIRQEHVLHLFEMNVGAHVGKWRVWIGMRDIFPFEKW